MSTSQNVLTLTGSNFQREVLESDKPVLVDFSAEWCQPCKLLSPTIDEIADEYAGKFKVGKVDTDADMELSAAYDISAIPSVLLFKGGKVHKKLFGLKSKQDILRAMQEVAGA
jgi:thioredoxin 1